jgi:hypothetical protein
VAACACCARSVGDGYLCTTCTQILADDLTDIADLLGELEITRTRQDRVNADPARRTGGEAVLPWKETAAEAHWLLATTALCWCRLVLDRVGPDHTDPVGSTAATWSAWLARHVGKIRLLVDAGECATEIGVAVDVARRAVDLPPAQVYVGPCDGQLDGGGRCVTDLYVRGNVDTVTCPDCTTEHNLDRRRTYLLAKAQDHLAPLPMISRALSSWLERTVTPSQLRGYVARNRLISRGTDRQGRALYRVGDAVNVVIDVWRQQHVS